MLLLNIYKNIEGTIWNVNYIVHFPGKNVNYILQKGKAEHIEHNQKISELNEKYIQT